MEFEFESTFWVRARHALSWIMLQLVLIIFFLWVESCIHIWQRLANLVFKFEVWMVDDWMMSIPIYLLPFLVYIYRLISCMYNIQIIGWFLMGMGLDSLLRWFIVLICDIVSEAYLFFLFCCLCNQSMSYAKLAGLHPIYGLCKFFIILHIIQFVSISFTSVITNCLRKLCSSLFIWFTKLSCTWILLLHS